MHFVCNPGAVRHVCRGLFWSQIGRVVYGAADEKRGFTKVGGKLHPKTDVVSGVLVNDCGNIMVDFFRRKR
jgi:tRNA(adenine34) deaminase